MIFSPLFFFFSLFSFFFSLCECVMSCLCCGPVYLRHVVRAVMYTGHVLELPVLCVHWYVSLFISVMLHVL